MLFSVIIPYHSSRNFLDLCVSSLTRTLPEDIEILLVLNNADQREIAIEYDDPRIRHIRITQSLGYSKAVNLGAAEARGRFLVICDADTAFTPGWFEALAGFHCCHNTTGLSGVKLINPQTGRIIDFGMGLTRYNNAHPFMDRPIGFELTLEPRRVQMACSACMMIKRDLFHELGGIDEELHNFYQDTDLSLRVNEYGGQCWVVPDAVVYHQGNSADSLRSPYRADVKGLYYAKNHSRMLIDMPRYFRENYRHLAATTPTGNHFQLVDLSSVADHRWHDDLVREFFRVLDRHEAYSATRDSSRIDLINVLPHALLRSPDPILYFVDRYVSLGQNDIWWRNRAAPGDIVVDRNGNMIAIEDLLRTGS